jgi:histidinol-phosphate aminotransferase
MPQFLQLLHPSVAKLKPYLPGKSIQEIEQKYGLKHVIKLASNENPWGCSPKVITKLRQISVEDISIYPNTYLHPFVKNLQKMLGIPADSIFVANGSDAIFSLLIQAFALTQQKSILSHQYAFMGYRTQAQSFGLECIEVPVDPKTWALDMSDLSQAVKPQTAIIFLANPNNPTGVLIPWTKICQLLEQVPEQTLVVIDEAYEEYINHDHPPLTNYLPAILILSSPEPYPRLMA